VVFALQEPAIQKVLKILALEKYISREVCDALGSAYIFLRNVEHRLQEFSDRQTHKLPSESLGKERLALSMGFDCPESFASEFERHTKTVHYHFENLLKTKDSDRQTETIENELKGVWQNLADEEEARSVLSSAGFDKPEKSLGVLNHLREDLAAAGLSREGRERIDKLLPPVLKEVGMSGQSSVALNRIVELIKSIKKRTSYISFLLENPSALTHLVRLADASPWILSFLTRHPVLLDEFLDARTLYIPPQRSDLEKDIRHRLSRVSSRGLEYQMDELRIFKQLNTLRVATADITESLPLMKVSDHLSYIAETTLDEVVALAWEHLVDIHGEPVCRLDGDEIPSAPFLQGDGRGGFAVIAYGKLGGLELGYASDLDLVFLHAGTSEETKHGKRPIDSSYFFARLGQRVIHILTARTPAGILYEADMRLRPSGSAGVLVSHIDAFEAYQIREAWTWEKQAIIRARFISGDIRLANRFEQIRKEAIGQPRDTLKLREEVIQMRERMRKETLIHDPEFFDLKQGTGGMVDIEFLVQYLVLLKSHEHSELLKWPDNVRLIGTLAQTGIIDNVAAYFLRKAYLTYRTVGHRLNLQDRAAKVPEHKFRHLRKKVEGIWTFFLGNES